MKPPINPSTAVWTPDRGDGTFCNPIIFADYSDPDAIRVGDDFYMTASSFHCTPGLPILYSRDLVNWTIINHALKNVPGEQYRRVQHNCGVWAPAIRHHGGKFWIFFPTPDEGIYVTTAADPAAEWSEPILMAAGKGLIDPCPLWDDDGKAYLVHAYAGSRAGIKNRLRVCGIAPDGTRLLDEGQVVFHEPERHPTLEGPKFLKKDGWYYILAPAGGVENGWQVALRSRDIYGPYEDKIVLERGPSPINGPHQGALIDLSNGEWWFMHFQERQPWGRITHLQPVTWKDGWPLMGVDTDGNGIGEPVLTYRKPNVAGTHPIAAPQTTDEFDSPKLGLQWQWHANHEDDWHSLTARPGWLRLNARFSKDADVNCPNLLAQKLPAEKFIVETTLQASLKPGGLAGLAMVGKQSAALAVRQTSQREIVWIIDARPRVIGTATGNVVKLRMNFSAGACQFSYSADGREFTPVEQVFQAVHDGWIGGKMGIFVISEAPGDAGGYADFDYFRVTSPF